MKEKLTNPILWRISLLMLGLLMVVVGIFRGEVGIVLKKSITICLECIGIG